MLTSKPGFHVLDLPLPRAPVFPEALSFIFCLALAELAQVWLLSGQTSPWGCPLD